MGKLNQFQLTLLIAAARDAGGIALLPKHPTPRHRQHIRELIDAKLVQETVATGKAPTWRHDTSGRAFALKITKAGFRLIAGAAVPDGKRGPTISRPIHPEQHRARQHSRPVANAADQAASSPSGPGNRPKQLVIAEHRGGAAPPKIPRPPTITKTAMLVRALRQPRGVTLAELCRKLDWQRHSVRAAISRHVRRHLRLDVAARIVKGRGRVLRVRRSASSPVAGVDRSQDSSSACCPIQGSCSV